MVVRLAVRLALLLFQGGMVYAGVILGEFGVVGREIWSNPSYLEGMEVEANQGKAERSRIRH